MTTTEFFEKLNSGATWSAGVSFKRAMPLPLDKYSVFASKADADAYAAESAVAYPGQVVAVVSETEDGVYYIGHDMALKEMGGVVDVDGTSIVLGEDGKLTISGFAAAAEGAQPRKNASGSIEWIVPSTETVDGLQNTVSGMQSDISALRTDVDAVESDLADTKTELTAAIATAKQEAIDAVLGEGVDADFDTLKEIAEWIQSDTTNSTELINRVSAIEGDYLKGADKTELEGEIDSLSAFVGDIPEDATSSTVVEYIKEVVDGLAIGDYAKASELTALAERVTTLEGKVDGIEAGAQVNKIDGVSNEFTIAAEGKILAIQAIEMSKVTGLPEALTARDNLIEKLTMNGVALTVGENKTVDIPGATQAALGVVKGSEAENGVFVNEDFTMEVKSLNVNRLVQTNGDVLVLDGGGADI